MSQANIDASKPPPNLLLGAGLVWMAVLIYASSSSIVSLLADIGRQNPVMGRNAISLCNLLLLGSLISLVPMVFTFRKDWTKDNLRKLNRKDWAVLTLAAVLSSAISPILFFIALENTTVTNVVLIGRIEPPLFLLAALIILKEKLDFWAMGAGLVALLGAVTIIMMNEADVSFTFGKGEIATVFATLSFIASTIVARLGLKDIPLGIFSIYRTALGTVIYFFLTLYLYGLDHFQDVFSAVVLKWVWVYAIIVIIIGQFSWTIGLKHARAGDISLATSFSPVAALIIAMLLLGENPGPGLIPGGLIILSAIGIGQYGRIRAQRLEKQMQPETAGEEEDELQTEEALEHEGRVNFKGA